MRVRAVEPRDQHAWAAMRAALWPEADTETLAKETAAHFAGDPAAAAVFVAERSDGVLVGLLELSLRAYAEGCASSPTPFIEAWHVARDARGRGVGRALIEAGEAWARRAGFREIASDSVLGNEAGSAAHQALGFEAVERIVCFRKSLGV